MKQFSVQKVMPAPYQIEIQDFIRSLKHTPLTRQEIKTIRGQALAGDLVGAQKGLERMVSKYEYNRAV